MAGHVFLSSKGQVTIHRKYSCKHHTPTRDGHIGNPNIHEIRDTPHASIRPRVCHPCRTCMHALSCHPTAHLGRHTVGERAVVLGGKHDDAGSPSARRRRLRCSLSGGAQPPPPSHPPADEPPSKRRWRPGGIRCRRRPRSARPRTIQASSRRRRRVSVRGQALYSRPPSDR